MTLFVPLLAALSLLLASCARDSADPAPVRAPAVQIPRQSTPTTPPAATPSPREFVRTASSIDLLEIRSAELALSRSGNSWVRDFAAMMISAHKGTSAQLAFAGRRLNLLPSNELLPRHQAMLAELSGSPDFNAVYLRQQRLAHREALALHGDFAARGSSPTLRAVAASTVPVIERHVRLLRMLRN